MYKHFILIALLSSVSIHASTFKVAFNEEEKLALKYIEAMSQQSLKKYKGRKNFIAQECHLQKWYSTLLDLAEINSENNPEWMRHNRNDCIKAVRLVMKELHVISPDSPIYRSLGN